MRFRVDGILREVLEPRAALAPLLVSRIKVMARLDIAEKRLPQDGRVSLRVGGHEVDVRISTIPSQYGERVVMRLLDRDATRLGLDRLGMSPRDRDAFERLLARPRRDPAGDRARQARARPRRSTPRSGSINDRSRNIMTVEDPIEYSVDGVGQTQVNARTDLTFARGLRAILRQDPDVIMVGEIRDRETAQIAVRVGDDRAFRAVDAAYEHRRRRGLPPDRHGRRAVPAGADAGRRGGAAAGAAAVPGLRAVRHRDRGGSRSAGRGDRGGRAAFAGHEDARRASASATAGARASTRLSRSTGRWRR